VAVLVRLARAADNAQIAAIWNREALATAATTDTEPRTPRAQRAWLRAHDAVYPVVVAAEGTEVLAFGALAPYRPKPSYRRTVEDSVYVKDGYRGKGVGSLVLDRLVTLARARGHHSMIARITAVNEASLRLHERLGFLRAGVEREAAYKLGRWLDVVTFQLML
jgi:phosphinothricin acetyltransferase